MDAIERTLKGKGETADIPPHPAVERWLEWATRKLIEADAARVREEVRAQYADAVAAALRYGLSPVNAHTAAMLALGDPVEAGKRYARELGTPEELKVARHFVKSISELVRTWVWTAPVLFLLLYVLPLIPPNPTPLATWFAETAVPALPLYVFFVVAWRGVLVPKLRAGRYVSATVWTSVVTSAFSAGAVAQVMEQMAAMFARTPSLAQGVGWLGTTWGPTLLACGWGVWAAIVFGQPLFMLWLVRRTLPRLPAESPRGSAQPGGSEAAGWTRCVV